MSPTSKTPVLVLRPTRAENESWPILHERSPAVSLAIAIALLGCLLAGSAETPLPHFFASVVLLVVATGLEVRSLHLPVLFGIASLAFVLGWIGWREGIGPLVLAVGGALFFPFLLAPFLATGYVANGTLAASAAFGALWGPRLVPAVFLIGVLLGGIFIALRARRSSNLRTLPMTAALGFAAALVQLVR